MRLPRPRGPLSAAVLNSLRNGTAVPDDVGAPPGASVASMDVVADDDVQLTLWVLYELHYRGFDGVVDREWDPGLLRVRGALERRFEDALWHQVEPHVTAVLREVPRDPTGGAGSLTEQVGALVDRLEGADLAGHLQRHATARELVDFLTERSVYHLKESDPSSLLLTRLDGRAKVALAELLYDEYGGGRPDRLHSHLFAEAMAAVGLDPTYGHHLDVVPAVTLAVNNAMSMFALNRRLHAASLGHLAAFESTSALPCRRIAQGVRRLGLPDAVAEYFTEHVEADSVHEQVVLHDICAAFLDDEPAALPDLLFGVATCVHLDDRVAAQTLRRWERGDVLDPGAPAPLADDRVAM